MSIGGSTNQTKNSILSNNNRAGNFEELMPRASMDIDSEAERSKLSEFIFEKQSNSEKRLLYLTLDEDEQGKTCKYFITGQKQCVRIRLAKDEMLELVHGLSFKCRRLPNPQKKFYLCKPIKPFKI